MLGSKSIFTKFTGLFSVTAVVLVCLVPQSSFLAHRGTCSICEEVSGGRGDIQLQVFVRGAV